jgi:hypothetical protein
MVTAKKKSGKAHTPATSKYVGPKGRRQSVTGERRSSIARPAKTRDRLRPWLELARLLPPPPSRENLKQFENGSVAIDPVRQWQADLRTMPSSELLSRFEHSQLSQEPAIAALLDLHPLRADEEEASRFHDLVSEVASALQVLAPAAQSTRVLKASGDAPVMIYRRYRNSASGNSASSRNEVWIRHGRVATQLVDPFKEFLTALDGVEASRVNQCPVCHHVFVAFRKDQKACSKRCNSIRRVRAWRANQERHEYNRKLRGAGLLKQRKRKR